MGDISPINIGYIAAIHTTHAVSMTATQGSAAITADTRGISIEGYGLHDFFVVH
jgi:hypothetical protein